MEEKIVLIDKNNEKKKEFEIDLEDLNEKKKNKNEKIELIEN
jgi:hypothetical protein